MWRVLDIVRFLSAGRRRRDGVPGAHDLVGRRARRDVDDARRVALHLGGVVLRVGDDDDRVAAVHEARGRAVDLHLARAAPAGDRVGLEAGAVVDVDDMYLLV